MAATNKPSLLRKRMMAAAYALLGASPVSQAAKAPEPAAGDRWTWDTSYLQYNEAERISVSEPQIGVTRDYSDGRSFTILATVDTISGSTPIGTLPATPATAPATTTSPSGHPINPIIGKVPTTTIRDTRLALGGTYERPLSSVDTQILGVNVSREQDFLSLGASTSFTRDLNQKNTTLTFGVSPEFDILNPNGGAPNSYSAPSTPGEIERRNKTRYLVSALIGVTQVINRKTLMQFNYSPTYENGYLNEPYKLLSIVNTTGDPLSSIHEKRPGSRLAHSLYWQTRYNLRAQDVFGLGLRYYTDDWGIRSQMIDFTYRWQYHEKHFLEPHIRYYHQTQADFFKVGLADGQPLPNFASSDYRLNAIDGVTIGLRWGWTFRNDSELILRAEYYTQTGEQKPNTAVGLQKAYNLFPTLNASILQVDYRFEPAKLLHKKKVF